jgi:hypothetical protein
MFKKEDIRRDSLPSAIAHLYFLSEPQLYLQPPA